MALLLTAKYASYRPKIHLSQLFRFPEPLLWNQAKRHLRKFNGVPKEHFGLFLKECEWRFNNSDPSAQLKQLRQWVKGNLN